MSLYYKIQRAWSNAYKITKADPLVETPETEKARKLEQLLADRFESSIEQYNQGLISASELFTQLYIQAYNPIQAEERETL